MTAARREGSPVPGAGVTGVSAAREWVESLEGYEALGIAPDGATWQTGGLGAYTKPG